VVALEDASAEQGDQEEHGGDIKRAGAEFREVLLGLTNLTELRVCDVDFQMILLCFTGAADWTKLRYIPTW